MTFLLFLLYVVLFGYWIKHASFFKEAKLSTPLLYFVFATKIGLGLLYAYIHQYYFHGKDTFVYFNGAVQISNTLLECPQYYIDALLGKSPISPSTEVFTYPNSFIFWKDLGTYSIVHIHALLNFLAFDQYELHLVFIAMIGMYASVTFYKLFSSCLNLPRPILIIACFFLPSLTFWTSGLHKEAYIYLGLSLFMSALYSVQWQGWTARTILKAIAGIFIIGIIRHYLLLLLLPATVAYLISLRIPNKPWRIYAFTYISCIFVGSLAAQIIFNIDLLQILTKQQALFFSEKGGSTITGISPMEPTFWSVAQMIPTAIVNVMGRPFLWECKDFLQVLAAMEIMCFSLLAALALLFRKPTQQAPNPLIPFIITYVVSNLLLIGLLVINVGTIARYRSISLGLFSVLLSQLFDFYRVHKKKSKSKILPPSSSLSSPKSNTKSVMH